MGYAPLSNQMFSTVAEMRLQDGTTDILVVAAGRLSSTDGNGGVFGWDAASTAADDSVNVIKAVSATGRWVRVKNASTVKGNITLIVTNTLVSSTYNHALGFVPNTVILQPTSANILPGLYHDKNSLTDQSFTIRWTPISVGLSLNVTLDFVIIKY